VGEQLLSNIVFFQSVLLMPGSAQLSCFVEVVQMFSIPSRVARAVDLMTRSLFKPAI
jgi:hypothetical protein